MTDRQTTHGPGCWDWGAKHYECALREIERLAARLTAAQQPEARGGGEAEPTSAPVGVDFSAVASILRRAMRDGAHYGYRRDFILQQALALEALAQQPAAAGEESSKGADVAQPKRRRYDPSGSLSEYGIFPECDAQPLEHQGDK